MGVFQNVKIKNLNEITYDNIGKYRKAYLKGFHIEGSKGFELWK